MSDMFKYSKIESLHGKKYHKKVNRPILEVEKNK